MQCSVSLAVYLHFRDDDGVEATWISSSVKCPYCLWGIFFFFQCKPIFSTKGNTNVSSHREEKNADREAAFGGSVTWLVIKGGGG